MQEGGDILAGRRQADLSFLGSPLSLSSEAPCLRLKSPIAGRGRRRSSVRRPNTAPSHYVITCIMVSSLLVDALARPSQAIQDIANDAGDLNELPSRVSTYFSDIFASDDAFNEVCPVPRYLNLSCRLSPDHRSRSQNTSCIAEAPVTRSIRWDGARYSMLPRDLSFQAGGWKGRRLGAARP